MTERLTDEQVAEMLVEAESVDRPCRLTVGWRRNSHERMAQLALQVSADLSAAKASNRGLCVQLDATQDERDLCEAQRDSAAKSLAALQEAAREAVGAMTAVYKDEVESAGGRTVKIKPWFADLSAALSALRSLLPEEER